MSEYDVKVKSNRQRKPQEGKSRQWLRRAGALAHGLLRRPRLLFTLCVAAFLLIVGTPHAGWDYECRHSMRGPGTCTYVEWCAYYGIQGRRIVTPEDGAQCSVITFLPFWA